MRVDECEVGGHLPSHQDWQKKKKRETPIAAASGGQQRRRRLGDGFLGAPGSCSLRPVGARAGAAHDPGRARGAPRGQYGRIPRDRRPSAWGLTPAERGARGDRGARGSGPPGERPLLAEDPARSPGSASERRGRRRREPFCFAGPALLPPPGSRATSAAAATTAAPTSARQSRSGAGARGRRRARARRAFPLPGRAPAGTTSS